jgi:hypothetical protein
VLSAADGAEVEIHRQGQLAKPLRHGFPHR